jgi:anti-sigma B factor antagonist
MKIKVQDYEGVSVVDLQGELDSDVAEMFANTISDLIAKSRTGIVLDMRDIVFIDSKGLEKLLWARDYCSQNRRAFRMAGLDDNCRKILEITRLDNEFDYYDELTEAVKSFT